MDHPSDAQGLPLGGLYSGRYRDHQESDRIKPQEIQIRWAIAWAFDGSIGAEKYLVAGWEPFAVSGDRGNQIPKIWFRRQVGGNG